MKNFEGEGLSHLLTFFLFIYHSLQLMNVTGTRLRLMKVSVMRKRLFWKTSLWYPRSPTGYFHTVISIQIFAQSRSPDGYFRHPASRAYLQSRNSPPYCFEIPNPGLQIRQIQHPEKPLGDPHTHHYISVSMA